MNIVSSLASVFGFNPDVFRPVFVDVSAGNPVKHSRISGVAKAKRLARKRRNMKKRGQ